MDSTRSEPRSMAAPGCSEVAPEVEVPLMRMPQLAWLAAAAALTDALMNRLGLRVLASDLPHGTRVLLERWGGVPRNLAAVAGLAALALGLMSFVRRRGFVSLPGRIGLAAFSGILLPTLLLATVLPAARTTPPIILLATGAAEVLAILLCVAVIGRRGPTSLRLGMAALAMAALLGFAAIVVGIASGLFQSRIAYSIAGTMARTGELAWLLLPFVFGVALWPERGSRGRLRRLSSAGAIAVVAMLLFGLAQLRLRSHFADVFYGFTHLSFWLESAPALYGPLLAVAAATVALGLLSPRSADRQIGAGLVLLAASGFAPRSPILLLYLALGTLLLTRGSLARATLAATRDLLDRDR